LLRRTLVVVVNYRTPDLTVDCLSSLAAEVAANPGLRAVVVDNGSGDDSATRIEAAIAARGWRWAELLRLACNAGYGAGNNAALRPALTAGQPPDDLLLLNSDTLVRPGAVGALTGFLAERPAVGLVGCRLEAPDGTPRRSAFRFPNLASELDGALQFGPVSRLLRRWWVAPPVASVPRPADWLAGAALLVRRAVFESVGLFDEAYFLYYEDVDLCRRAWQAGWSCWYLPASRVVHLVGRSSGLNSARHQPPPDYWFAGRRRYFLKHHGAAYALAADAAQALGLGLRAGRWALQRPTDPEPARLLVDFVRRGIVRPAFKL
jgi:GT2 family glycosyltransferase